jgi:hypothetical protein
MFFYTLLVSVFLLLLTPDSISAEIAYTNSLFGKQVLVEEIECGTNADPTKFRDFPKGWSQQERILGQLCRVLPNSGDSSKYFAYRLGKGKNLKPGAAYLLTVEFPDNVPRTMFICNWGCETAMGLHTGPTVGDALVGKYVNNNPESLQVPLSGKMQTWQQFFRLHDRFCDIERPRGLSERTQRPEDGFWVIIAQVKQPNAPLSHGAAVSKISLFEITHPETYHAPIHYPPDDLPRRYLFWREEMSDGVVAMGHSPEEKMASLRGVTDPVDWYEYKVKLAAFLGINTFSMDLLEFGHNQGWDPSRHGGHRWWNPSPDAKRWERILDRVADYDMPVLPYYEYAGSIGGDPTLAIGSQRRCVMLNGGKDYTHVEWCHKTNADIADPAFIEDARKLFDCTILPYKDSIHFLGAWLRPRHEAMPISFNNHNLKRFADETRQEKAITRQRLQAEPQLLDAYYDWWFDKRKEFNTALVSYLRKNVNPDSILLFTADASEPGVSIPANIAGIGQKEFWNWKTSVVNDNPSFWQSYLESQDVYKMVKPLSFQQAVASNMHLGALLRFPSTYGNYEWQHACPPPDPQNYKDSEGSLFSHTINRLYTVSSPDSFDAFRSPSGLAVVRHYALNEHELETDGKRPLGYFVADMERAGPFCMMPEARAMAFGDPRYIGYLAGNNFNRGFPEYVRAFNQAFLALPALPSQRLDHAASDTEVIVRAIDAGRHGTYLAIVNIGFKEKESVRISLPIAGHVVDAVKQTPLPVQEGAIEISLYPAELKTVHIMP